MANCPNCGNDVGDSKFCPNCGTKIEYEKDKAICPNCGSDVGDSKFCPNCGTKMGEKQDRFCPSCGKSLDSDVIFCPYCGWSETEDNSDNLDKLIDLDNKLSGKFYGALGKSKTFDKIFDKTATLGKKYITTENSLNRSYWENIEPIFLEALDTIDDEYVKTILLIERRGLSSTAGVSGLIVSSVYTPTKDMTHDEAIAFYQEWAENIAEDINKEKQNGTFDEDEYYKKRFKSTNIENASFIGIPKSYKNWKNNQD